MKYLLLVLFSISLYGETVVLKPIEITGDGWGGKDPFSNVEPLEHVESKVQIQETLPGFKSPIVKGLQGDKILLTLDGIKFSNALFRSGPNQYYSWIPDEFVVDASLDEPLGTITSGALGGSIDRKLGIDKSKVGASFRSDNLGHTELVKYNNDGVSVGVVNHDTSNLRTPNGEVQHSSYNQQGIFFENDSKAYGQSKLLFSKSNDIERTDKFQKGQYYVYDLQQYLLLSHKYYLPDSDMAIIPSFQQFKEKIDKHSPNKKDTDSTNNIYGLQTVGYYDDYFDSGYISYGLVDNYEDIDYKTGVNTNTYGYNTFSAYATYSDNYEKLDYDLLYKFSNMNVTGSGLNRNLSNNAVGIHTKYKLGFLEFITLKGDLNYKFPTITNLAEARDDSVTEIANPNLKQERAYTLELGYRRDWFTTSIFYKKLYDMIIRTQTDIPDGNGDFKWQYNNTDEGRIYGANIEVDKKWDNGYGLYMFGEYLDGKTDYDYISKLTPFHSTVKTIYKPYYIEWLWALKVSEDKMALKDQTDIRIKDHNNGYSIFNLGYKKVYNKKHDVEVVVTNLFDSTGRVYGSSVDFGERGIYLSYKYNY